MNWTFIRRFSALLLFTFSLVMLAWSLWPRPAEVRSLTLSPAEMRPTELPPGASADLTAIVEPRLLLLDWTPVMRAGESSTVRLLLGFTGTEGSPQPTSPLPGDQYSVLAEARLELPGLPHSPPGEMSQALLPGRPLAFTWDLLPVAAGEAGGTVWLHLRFIPSAGGPELRQVLTAQRIQVQVIDFLGLSSPWARALGSAGVAVGVVLGLDGVALWLWSRSEQKVIGTGWKNRGK